MTEQDKFEADMKISASHSRLEKAIWDFLLEQYGRRCFVFQEKCPICEAWKSADEFCKKVG